MKLATAAYPLDALPRWADYSAKIETWVAEAAGEGAELLVFPEYGAMEFTVLAGDNAAADNEASLRAVSDIMPEADALHVTLAERYGVHILGASAPVYDASLGDRPVNRAKLFTPSGQIGVQDKQIMTRYEREPMDVVSGGPLRIFETSLGKIGILICYDSEFPLLGRALSEVDLLLVPSCTEALSGYWRVRIGAMARALEAQCVSVMSSLVGSFPACPHVDENTGMGGVFGPPDVGFPATGVLSEGVLAAPGWTYAEVNLEAIAHVREDGRVLGRTHWTEQDPRAGTPEAIALR